ncbi:g264 [Yersinia phage phiR1-37]|uniref:hypothetical protein n=1 Tax=Yersinia phage phiR1-37 TaxID=331278 RepID=UPI00022DBDB3|nr:hypothetical protein phiR1-37_gp264 [Yersinia phage phiR1-37]CCE26287.1 g264 [Yersinia phage phiR1-37]
MNIYVNESNGDVYQLKRKTAHNVLFDILSKGDKKEATVIPLLATKPLKEMSENDYVIKVLKKYESNAESITVKELNTLHNLGYQRLTHVMDMAI